jgi:glycine cleavage system aminomethyltransferase T
VCIASTWCCRTTARRAIVAGTPSAVARWHQVERRVVASGGLRVSVDALPEASALSLVGPRATRIISAAGLPGELHILEVADVTLAGAPLTLVREDGDRYLLLFERGYPLEACEALWDAGRELGLAPVGTEALELLHAAHRSFG